jgi:hypothetical protein
MRVNLPDPPKAYSLSHQRALAQELESAFASLPKTSSTGRRPGVRDGSVFVKDYGGITVGQAGYDSTDAVLSAQADAEASPGSTLVFEPGIYQIASDITFDLTKHGLRGTPGLSLIRPFNSCTVAVTLKNVNGPPRDVYGLWFHGVDAPTKQGLRVGPAGTVSQAITLTYCRVSGFNSSGGVGVQFADVVDYGTIGCQFYDNWTNELELASVYNLPVQGAHRGSILSFAAGPTSLDIQSGRFITWDQRCDFEANQNRAVWLRPGVIGGQQVPIYGVGIRHSWLEGNWVTDATKYQVVVDGTGTTREVEFFMEKVFHGSSCLFVDVNAVRRFLDDGCYAGTAQSNDYKIGGAATIADFRNWNRDANGAPSAAMTFYNGASLAGNVALEEARAGIRAITGDLAIFSPNGTRYAIRVSNAGVLSTAAV